jgi:dihydrofolate reductase
MTEAAWPNTRFLRAFADVAALKAAPGKDIYLMGGGRMVRSLTEAGLVDELRLITYPVIAGGPNDLFGSSANRYGARLIASRQMPGGLVRTDYRILGRMEAPAVAAAE